MGNLIPPPDDPKPIEPAELLMLTTCLVRQLGGIASIDAAELLRVQDGYTVEIHILRDPYMITLKEVPNK